MGRTGYKRPWLAVLLAVVQPGLGHVYLRRWGRAVLWFGLAVSTALVFVPEVATPSPESLGGILDAVIATQRELPAYAAAALFTVRLLNTLDAYWVALRSNAAEVTAAASCPTCGKELDEDLEFCHWCTTRYDAEA